MKTRIMILFLGLMISTVAFADIGPVPVPGSKVSPSPSPSDSLDVNNLTPRQRNDLAASVALCNACHSTSPSIGVFGVQSTPYLASQPRHYIEDQINNFRTEFRNDPDAQIMWSRINNIITDDTLIPYIADYFSKSDLSDVGPDQCGFPWVGCKLDEKIANGKDIYQNGIPARNVIACQYCHGENAEGADPVPRLAGQRSTYINNQLTYFRDGYRGYAAQMPQETKSLTDDEIDALAEYVNSL